MMNFFLSIMCVLMFVYVVGSWIILKLIWWLCSVVIWLGVGMFFSLSVISGQCLCIVCSMVGSSVGNIDDMNVICSVLILLWFDSCVICFVCVVCCSVVCVFGRNMCLVLFNLILCWLCLNRCVLSFVLSVLICMFSVGCMMNRCCVVCLKCSFFVSVMKVCNCLSFMGGGDDVMVISFYDNWIKKDYWCGLGWWLKIL